MAEEDWKSIHLSWIKSHENFVPKYAADYSVPYYNIMHQVYNNPACTQAWAENCYYKDVEWDEKVRVIKKKVKDNVLKGMSVPCSMHFITINFNHETWSIDRCIKVIKCVLDFKWIQSGTAVFELHRSNGIHPHCHMVIEADLPKSTLINRIFASRGMQIVCSGRNFIDYKVALPEHTDYVKGIKQAAKLPYVEMDKEWREKNNIPHIFTK